MFVRKTDEYSKCKLCGKDIGRNYIIIATGYVEAKPFIRKQSAEQITALCVECGKEELSKVLQNIQCPIWIGIPTLDKKGNVAINFVPKIIH